VIFALPVQEVAATVLMAFKEEFNSDGLRRSIWKQGRFLAPRTQGDLCLDVNIQSVKWEKRNGVKANLGKPSDFARREQQHWFHLECGRIVLAAFPELCLSAKEKDHGADVHIWCKVEKHTQYLQIWNLKEDGSIVLKSDPDMYLSYEEGAVKLRKATGIVHSHLWDWHYYMEQTQSVDQSQQVPVPTVQTEGNSGGTSSTTWNEQTQSVDQHD